MGLPKAAMFGWPVATEKGLLFASRVCQPTLCRTDTLLKAGH